MISEEFVLASTNVSAVAHFADGTIKSLGTTSTQPYFRGRNLLLEYRDGSPCLDRHGNPTGLQMSSLISFKCDHELVPGHASISFLSSPDNCTYVFEARSVHACPSSNDEQSVAPVPFFFIICGIGILVSVLASFILKPQALEKYFSANNKSVDTNIKGRNDASEDNAKLLPISQQDVTEEESHVSNKLLLFFTSLIKPSWKRMQRFKFYTNQPTILNAENSTIPSSPLLPNGLDFSDPNRKENNNLSKESFKISNKHRSVTAKFHDSSETLNEPEEDICSCGKDAFYYSETALDENDDNCSIESDKSFPAEKH